MMKEEDAEDVSSAAIIVISGLFPSSADGVPYSVSVAGSKESQSGRSEAE